MRNYLLPLFILLLTACAPATATTEAPVPTSTGTPVNEVTPVSKATPAPHNQETIDLHVTITDGQNPVGGTIWLYWPDTGGDFAIGPTADVVLPIPADGAAILVTVTAPGYLTWSETLTPTRSLNLVVRLIQDPQPSAAGDQEIANWHVTITDGQNPVVGTIRLHWPGTGGNLTIGPTADIILPLPANDTVISVTVTAPGYLTWSKMLTPTTSLNLVVRLIQNPQASDL